MYRKMRKNRTGKEENEVKLKIENFKGKNDGKKMRTLFFLLFTFMKRLKLIRGVPK